MRSFRLMALLAMCLMLLAAPVQAKTTITFWHGMGGELGEITDEMIKEFNASQDKYEVKGVYKGNYDEAMTAAIAASAPVEGLSPLTVEVGGAGEAGLAYLWQGSADGGRTWFSSGCAGQGTATLKVAANKANAEGMVFRCVVTASDGRTATTEPASILLS